MPRIHVLTQIIGIVTLSLNAPALEPIGVLLQAEVVAGVQLQVALPLSVRPEAYGIAQASQHALDLVATGATIIVHQVLVLVAALAVRQI